MKQKHELSQSRYKCLTEFIIMGEYTLKRWETITYLFTHRFNKTVEHCYQCCVHVFHGTFLVMCIARLSL